MTLKHAASLITARLSFFGQRAGTATSQPNLEGRNDLCVNKGKVYKTKTHKEVPATNFSLTEVQDYVKELPLSHVVEYTDVSQFPQYKSMVDFVTTMRVACEPKGTAFTWPERFFALVNAFSVALTHLPPGHIIPR